MDFKIDIEEQITRGVTVANSRIAIRLGFIRKVYGILSAQLLLTIAVAGIFMFHEGAKTFIQSSPNLMLFGCLASFGLIIALHIKRKETPINFYLLTAFTLVEAFTIGFVVTLYDTFSVLQAFGLTVGTVIALTIYTFQSKRDFSSWGATLFSLLWILIWSSLFQVFFPSSVGRTVLSGIGAFIFCAFIIYDTHMVMTKLSPEEYILASINLYLDILNLFLELLKLFGKNER